MDVQLILLIRGFAFNQFISLFVLDISTFTVRDCILIIVALRL